MLCEPRNFTYFFASTILKYKSWFFFPLSLIITQLNENCESAFVCFCKINHPFQQERMFEPLSFVMNKISSAAQLKHSCSCPSKESNFSWSSQKDRKRKIAAGSALCSWQRFWCFGRERWLTVVQACADALWPTPARASLMFSPAHPAVFAFYLNPNSMVYSGEGGGRERDPVCINREVNGVTVSCWGANDSLLGRNFILGEGAEFWSASVSATQCQQTFQSWCLVQTFQIQQVSTSATSENCWGQPEIVQ